MMTPGLLKIIRIEDERTERVWRWILAAPMGFLISILIMASFPLFLPKGAGGVNHVVLPVLAFPFIWATLIILPVSTRRVGKMALIYAGLLLFCLIVIILSFVV